MNPNKEGQAIVSSFKGPKSVTESCKAWISHILHDPQQSKSEYLDYLIQNDTSVFESLREILIEGAIQSGTDVNSAYPNGWLCLYFSDDSEVKKYARYWLRHEETIQVKSDGFSVGLVTYKGLVVDPIVVIQDFFGRTCIFEDYGTYIYNPLNFTVSKVTGKIHKIFFKNKRIITPFCMNTAFWAVVSNKVDCKDNKEMSKTIKNLDTESIVEILNLALKIEVED